MARGTATSDACSPRRTVAGSAAFPPTPASICGSAGSISSCSPRRRCPPGAPRPEDPNPRGVAAIVSSGDFDLWLSADAESDAILPLPLRPVEAMKVSHHGSADPGLPEVLERLRPSVAAIEVGAGNSYGHPTPATLRALHAAVPHVYRTDRDGTVTLTVRDGHIAIETER